MSNQEVMMCQALSSVDYVLSEKEKEEKAIDIVRNILENEIIQNNFKYRGYFLYNKNHPKKWLEFDVTLLLHPDIYMRTSCVSNSDDPDVILCRKVTDKIIEEIKFLYQSREQTRIIIEFNDSFTTAELKMTISE